MRVGGHIEAGDDAEVVGAAFEGQEEVVVGGCGGGVDGLAAGEDDFVPEDCVAGPAVAAGEECYASFKLNTKLVVIYRIMGMIEGLTT